jgi:hypothetical protein
LTLTLTGTVAHVELHPIVHQSGRTPCFVAVFAAPDVYNEMIAADRNAFAVPTAFTVATSLVPAARSP